MNTAKYYIILILFIAGCSFSEKPVNPYLQSKDGFIEVEGGKIWYGIMGEGDNTPLIQLHGGPGQGQEHRRLSVCRGVGGESRQAAEDYAYGQSRRGS